MSDIITEINGNPIRWTDAQGVTHYVEGADVHPGIRLLWPRCGQGDVPANQAWIGGNVDVDCPACISKVTEPEP